MLRELINFASVRSGKDAFVFYCVYFLFIILIVTTLSRAFHLFLPEVGAVQYISILTTLILCEFLAYQILARKKIADNFNLYFFLVLTAILVILGGPLLGMIPVAYLTTMYPTGDKLTPPSHMKGSIETDVKM